MIHWAARVSHQKVDMCLWNRDFSWDLVRSECRSWIGEGRSYLHVRSLIIFHHDHLGMGLDLRIKIACLNEEWDGPSLFNWDTSENWRRCRRASQGRVPLTM